jgi:hypothetical protein
MQGFDLYQPRNILAFIVAQLHSYCPDILYQPQDKHMFKRVDPASERFDFR